MSGHELSDLGRLVVIRDRYGEGNPMIGVVETLIDILEDCKSAGMAVPAIDWQRVEAFSRYCPFPVPLTDLLVCGPRYEVADDGTITIS